MPGLVIKGLVETADFVCAMTAAHIFNHQNLPVLAEGQLQLAAIVHMLLLDSEVPLSSQALARIELLETMRVGSRSFRQLLVNWPPELRKYFE